MLSIMPWVAILVTVVAAYGIVKNYKTHMVLFCAGFVLITLSVIAGNHDILPKGAKSSGTIIFDIFDLFRLISIRQISGIGFLILIAGGFSTYMERIGAAGKLVQICVEPLRFIKNPYVLLPFAFLIGHALGVVVPSAAGLAMLLVVSMFPLLVGLGVTPPAAAAIIGSTLCMSYPPTSPMSILSAKTIGAEPVALLIQYQLALAIPVAIVIAVLHGFVQRYFDKKEGLASVAPVVETESRIDPKTAALPAYYALFPLVPLVLLIIFNKLVWKTIVLDTSTAMIIGWFLAIVIDLLRNRDIKKTFDDSMAMFSGMGAILVSVVSLIFVADFFSSGLQASGLIKMLMDTAKASDTGVTGSTVVLSACVGFIALLTGSGVAAFTSLVGLVPPLAQSVGGDPGSMILPIQFASEMIRPISPVAGVIIIVAGAAKVSPISIAKRQVIPMGVGMLAVLMLNYVLFA
jgi:DcuC family C4-dicarboxylate transporter